MILGLSHVFGETRDISSVTSYWESRGWRKTLSLSLDVPPDKREILRNRQATNVALDYFEQSSVAGAPGIEFVTHSPTERAERGGAPASTVRLQIPGSAPATHRDPDGNTIVERPDIERPHIEWSVPDVHAARHHLRQLGFAQREASNEALTLESLFARRSLTLALVSAPERSSLPLVDDGGWNGLSLLVRDLDTMAAKVQLRSHQVFSQGPSEDREVAFFAGDGLLIEFLAIRRVRTPRSLLGGTFR